MPHPDEPNDDLSDEKLLRAYTGGSEEAFRRLVERHAGMVHAAARRQVRDPQTADDVTQAVFILLAKKASSLARPALLPGWLVKAAHFACRDARKREQRRTIHERKAAAMSASNALPGGPSAGDASDDAGAGEAMLAVLDDGLARLRESDRAAVTLRFLEGRSMSEVGAAVGVSEPAAAKRVGRAIEKLRAFFVRRGITLPAAGIGVLLVAESVKAAATPGLATHMSRVAVAAAKAGLIGGVAGAGAPVSFSIAKGAGDLMTLAKLKTAAALLAVSAATVGGGAALVRYGYAQTVLPTGTPATQIPISRAPAAIAPLTNPAAARAPIPSRAAVAPPSLIPAPHPAVKAADPVPVDTTPVKPLPPVPPVHRPDAQPPVPTANPVDTADGVSGIVRLDGKAPEAAVIDMSGVPQCQGQHAGQVVHEQSLVVGATGGIANVVVSIVIPDGVIVPEPKGMPASATLDQKGCVYHPHVVALVKGQKLLIQNSDPFLHNVHSQSENAPFNFAQPMIGKKTAPALKDPEYFHIKCDVHPWMSAWVAVMDNPYFAVTDENGRFTLPPGLPDGTYTVVAWHEKYDKQTKEMTVLHGKGSVSFDFKPE